MQDRLKAATRLERKGKYPIHATGMETQESDGSVVMVFTFEAGSQPIRVEDKEVVFVTRFGPMQLRARFPLTDMVYQGKLELRCRLGCAVSRSLYPCRLSAGNPDSLHHPESRRHRLPLVAQQSTS